MEGGDSGKGMWKRWGEGGRREGKSVKGVEFTVYGWGMREDSY